MTRKELAAKIDHTFLKAAGDPDAVKDLCHEAAEYGFACAMVNPAEVKNAAKFLKGKNVRVGTVVGFPLGQATAKMKVLEAQEAIKNGARDIDFVVNVRLLKAAAHEDAKALAALEDELEACAAVKTCAEGVVTKLILECCYLTDAEKVLACRLAKKAGFDFVKTSTGFGSGGATAEDVALMRKTVGKMMGVKAAGGIRTTDDALKMIEAGANRLGCSASVAIVQGVVNGD